uniref:Uncharacterized protein n=1 Tax=Toxoplasma gondii COUG TaxID=1074873 RepID=A0A2G8Y2S6_TOXGO|nr:hypothetical protein TGCOUG_290605 [Toxoplasma gondii COUG]
MTCVIELFPFACRANAVAFIPANQARLPAAGLVNPEETDQVSTDLLSEFASLTLAKPRWVTSPRERSNCRSGNCAATADKPPGDGLSGRKRPHVYLKEMPCTGGHTFGLYIFPYKFATTDDGANTFKGQEQQGTSAMTEDATRQATPRADPAPDQSSTDHEVAGDSGTYFVFQLPTRISSFRITSFSELWKYGCCPGFYLKLSLTLASRLCPLTMISEQNEVKLLRYLKPFRLQCKRCKKTMASVATPDVLALPSTLWTEMSEAVACEECSPVPVTKAALLAKPNRICVGTDHIALSPVDIDAETVRINRDKIFCNSCGSTVGYPTRTSAFRKSRTEAENHLHCIHQHEVDHADSSGTSCLSGKSQGSAESCELAEACFLKHKVYVQQLRPKKAPSDVFWRHTEVCLIAGSIERLCKKASIHKFLVERDKGEEDKAKDTGSCCSSEMSKIASLELTIVVREFFPLVIEEAQVTDRAASEALGYAPFQQFQRAMKVLFRAIVSPQARTDSTSHSLKLPSIPFEELLDELRRNARLYETSPVKISLSTEHTVSYLPLPPASPL